MSLGWKVNHFTCTAAEISQRFPLPSASLSWLPVHLTWAWPCCFPSVVDLEVWSDAIRIPSAAEHNGDLETLSLGPNIDARISFDNIIFFHFNFFAEHFLKIEILYLRTRDLSFNPVALYILIRARADCYLPYICLIYLTV